MLLHSRQNLKVMFSWAGLPFLVASVSRAMLEGAGDAIVCVVRG